MREQLSSVELAAGLCLGRDPTVSKAVAASQRSAQAQSPANAVERTIDRALRVLPDAPVYVAFSGGMDSSLLLSAATALRRRQQRPDPIPVTIRYDQPEADERGYQELVVQHLGLRTWIRLDAGAELDLLSESAQTDLLLHGISAAARVPPMRWLYERLAEPGTLVTGEGGDELFGAGPLAPLHFTLSSLKHRRHVRVATRFFRAHLTRQLRPTHTRLGMGLPDWLTPAGIDAVTAEIRSTYGARSLTVRGSHRQYFSMRANARILRDFELQAAEFGFRYVEPFMDATFIGELTSTTRDREFVDRNRFFLRHFRHLLPIELITRASKVFFNSAIFNEHTRRFAASFDAYECLPTELVRPELVRQSWLSADDARSGLMLQHAWLETHGRA